ncbi:hypothetical protein J0J23_22485, partial [Vibrio vulnificus]|uniref:hypothetical protein n=1 Tax=Vibrio vulnificus TaxID=672 RepID=UPI0019D43CB2
LDINRWLRITKIHKERITKKIAQMKRKKSILIIEGRDRKTNNQQHLCIKNIPKNMLPKAGGKRPTIFLKFAVENIHPDETRLFANSYNSIP